MKMTPDIEAMVFHFGEMGRRWGFNRTVGQVLALLVVVEEPLTANDIGDALTISRGNVSMAIKELQGWQVVGVQHQPGDRKEYYRVTGSIWDLANRVFEERRKREIDPTLSLLRDMLMSEPTNDKDAYALKQCQEIHDLLEMVTKWSSELQNLQPEKLVALMRFGANVSKVIDLKDKLLNKQSS